MFRTHLIVASFLIAAPGCRTSDGGTRTNAVEGVRSLEGLNAALWAQQSAEALAACKQAYALAALRLDEALKDKTWTAAQEQAPGFENLDETAVILDIDETVLDNSFYQARVVTTEPHSEEGFGRWVQEAAAPAIQSAREFCEFAASRGVDVFYVTNRSEDQEVGTLRNLREERFPLDPLEKRLYCKVKGQSDKGPRRKEIAKEHRILLLIGDNAGDFSSEFNGRTSTKRRSEAEKQTSMWGSRWIIIPNAMYGDWEAVSGGRSVESKLRALRTTPQHRPPVGRK